MRASPTEGTVFLSREDVAAALGGARADEFRFCLPITRREAGKVGVLEHADRVVGVADRRELSNRRLRAGLSPVGARERVLARPDSSAFLGL